MSSNCYKCGKPCAQLLFCPSCGAAQQEVPDEFLPEYEVERRLERAERVNWRGQGGSFFDKVKSFVVICVLISVFGAAFVPRFTGVSNPVSRMVSSVVPGPAGVAGEIPTAGAGFTGARLLPKVSVIRQSPSYTFTSFQEDGVSPVRYDPCRSWRYVVREDNMPAGALVLIKQAFAEISRASGVAFEYEGSTTEGPSDTRASFQRKVYGDRWAPILITWAGKDENPDFSNDVLGEGGSTGIRLGAAREYYFVTGSVQLDSVKLGDILNQLNGVPFVYAVILHELGHVVGLGHVDDSSQLMYPESRFGVSGFRDGDLTGLAVLGAASCAPWL